MRPIRPCRTFFSQELEDTVDRLKHNIKNPDLFQLFENSWPSTLDTTVAWQRLSNTTFGPDLQSGERKEEELTFVITGDIEGMWLRDSANQLQAYTSILRTNSSVGSLASVFHGAINFQARYILEDPFCNAFQAPSESGIVTHSSLNSDQITLSYDYYKVFSCQWELDSVVSFLQLSVDYMTATKDHKFFQNSSNWTRAVERVLETAESMMIDSYDAEENWQHTPYTYCAPYGGTPINDCNGSPHRGHIGLIRSFHRPSDDACTYQYLIPSNMMFSAALDASALIMQFIKPRGGKLAPRMRRMSMGINRGIIDYAIIKDPKYGNIYAYEIDGYRSHISMDDPNLPSLLSAPFMSYTTVHDPIYQNTCRKILSKDNLYYAWGPVISGVGSMHTRPGKVWPMANIMAILTSDDDVEIITNLRMLVGSTNGLGLMHESVDAHAAGVFSRPW
jgi:meiotically up-regulated gene 157 (Mug157) protein